MKQFLLKSQSGLNHYYDYHFFQFSQNCVWHLHLIVTLNIPKIFDQKILILFCYLLKKPFKPCSSKTISRWIKIVLQKSGINTDIFKAHSTTHASTSAPARKGLNIDVINKAACWTRSSAVFEKFYNRPVSDDTQFAESVGLS